MVNAVRDHAKYTDSQATEFLLEKVLKPTRVGDKRRKLGSVHELEDNEGTLSKEQTTGVHHKLKEGVSHIYGDLKRNVVSGWFQETISNPKSSMRPARATKWLELDVFYKQPGGLRAILAAATKGYKYLGALNRVHTAVGEGSDAVVELTCGYFVLCVKFIREELVSVQDQTPVKQGPDLNGYKDYVAEFLRLDGWLPKHGRAENGMLLCDGADPRRAVFEPEYLPAALPSVDDGSIADVNGGAPWGLGQAASVGDRPEDQWAIGQATTGGWGRGVPLVVGQVVAGEGGGAERPVDGVEVCGAAGCGRVEGMPLATAMPATAVDALGAVAREAASRTVAAPEVAAIEAVASVEATPVAPPTPKATSARAAAPLLSARARAAAIMAKAQAQAAALLELEDDDGLL